MENFFDFQASYGTVSNFRRNIHPLFCAKKILPNGFLQRRWTTKKAQSKDHQKFLWWKSYPVSFLECASGRDVGGGLSLLFGVVCECVSSSVLECECYKILEVVIWVLWKIMPKIRWNGFL